MIYNIKLVLFIKLFQDDENKSTFLPEYCIFSSLWVIFILSARDGTKNNCDNLWYRMSTFMNCGVIFIIQR